MPRKLKEYALYHGDDLLEIGTVPELAQYHNCHPQTIRRLATPSNTRRRKQGGNHLVVIKMEDDEE